MPGIDLAALDRDLIWHPFTQAAQGMPPLRIRRARGVRLYGENGQRYFDTISSWWTNLHGHGHPRLVRAIARQARRLDHVNFSGFYHEPAVSLAAALRERLPEGLSRFFYSDNGSSAVEAALNMAFQYFRNRGEERRSGFACLEGSYHGDTVGAMSLSALDDFHALFQPLRFPCLRLPSPVRGPSGSSGEAWTGNPVREACPEAWWSRTEALLRERGGELAALIVEPLILCAGGMRPYPAACLDRLVRLCRALGILVIFDEVATGFGRTGTFFALDQLGEAPDFLCLAKGLSGGTLPLALTVTRDAIFEAFRGDARLTFFHGHSYTANPIACAAGLASLEIFRKERTLEHLPARAQVLREGVEAIGRLPGVADVRHLGLMAAVDLEPAGAGQRVYRAGLEAGLVLRPLGDTIYWLLPLAVREREIKEIMRRSRQLIAAVLEGAGAGRAPEASNVRI